nr:MAG TPA: hypothetical protein [Caudoviricetes sp.]
MYNNPKTLRAPVSYMLRMRGQTYSLRYKF